MRDAGCQIGPEFFTLVSQAELKKLYDATNWRIRRACLELYADLGAYFKAPDLFEAHLQDLFFAYLVDKVSSIREFGNKQLPVVDP